MRYLARDRKQTQAAEETAVKTFPSFGPPCLSVELEDVTTDVQWRTFDGTDAKFESVVTESSSLYDRERAKFIHMDTLTTSSSRLHLEHDLPWFLGKAKVCADHIPSQQLCDSAHSRLERQGGVGRNEQVLSAGGQWFSPQFIALGALHRQRRKNRVSMSCSRRRVSPKLQQSADSTLLQPHWLPCVDLAAPSGAAS